MITNVNYTKQAIIGLTYNDIYISQEMVFAISSGYELRYIAYTVFLEIQLHCQKDTLSTM